VGFVKRAEECLKYSYIQCFSLKIVMNLKSKDNDRTKAPGVLGSANISYLFKIIIAPRYRIPTNLSNYTLNVSQKCTELQPDINDVFQHSTLTSLRVNCTKSVLAIFVKHQLLSALEFR
jgi:hypothetical protein